ncbi:MAG: DMT family transporter, partial [Bacteroidetes bacterium]|nr:DMT family transporter [Bacteroidota bacterium]
MKNNIVIGASGVSLAAILWGFDGVVLTPRLHNLSVEFVVFMLHLIPFAIMSVFMSKQFRKISTFSKGDLISILLVGLFGGAIGTIAIVKALFLVDFSHVSIVVLLQKLQPVFAIVLAAIILKEKIKGRFLLWAIIAITSGYFMAFGLNLPDFRNDATTITASLLAIVAAASFGSSTVFSKKVLKKNDFKTSTFFRYGFTTLFMLIYLLINPSLFNGFEKATQQNWEFFDIIGLTTGSGAIFIYYYGLA